MDNEFLVKRNLETLMKTTKKLNWLFKLTIHTFLCWTLTIFQIMPSVRADDVLEGGASNTPTVISGSTGSAIADNPETESGSGVIKVEGSEIKAASRFFFSNLALFFAGFMGPSLVKACPQSWSIRAFAVAAALYVANEIGLFTRFNSAINKEMVAYLGRGDEDRQIESLESAANQTRKAKEAAKRRALIAKIAGAGFGIAAAIATAEAAQVWGMTNVCAAPATTSLSPTSTILLVDQASNKPFQTLKEESFLVLNKTIIPMAPNNWVENYSDSIRPSRPNLVKRNGLMARFIAAAIPNTYAQEKVGTDKDAKTYKDGNDQVIIVNSVGAKLAATGLGVAGGLAVANMSSGPLSGLFQKIVQNKYARPLGFSTFALTAFGASKESSDSAKLLEQRAQEYDRLADSLRKRVDQGINTETGNGETIDQTVQGFDSSNGGTIGNNEICFTGGAASGLTADKNCTCASTNTCAGPQMPKTSGLPSFSGTSLLADNINGLKAASTDLFAGRLKGATTNGQALTNGAAKITKLRDALRKKINEDRLKAGANAIDFEGGEKKMASTIERQVENAFNNLSPREQSALARLGSGFGTGDADANKDDKKDDLADKGSERGKVVAAAINPNAGAANNKSADGAVWDFNFEEDAAKGAAEQAAIAAALAENEDENYQIEGDINDDRNKDIFNIITRRYLKSAYPVIFDER